MLGLLHRRISGRCMLSHFRLLVACRRNRLLPDRRSRFAHRTTYLRLALWRVARLRRNGRIFSRYCSRLSGLLVLWNRFCPGFPLRFGFCFRQPVGCLFCQMADLPHGMVGGIRDLAALVAILRLPILCCVAQLLPKLLKGSICAAAECCLRRGFEGFDGSRSFSGDFSLTSRITTPAPPVQTFLWSSADTAYRFSGNDPQMARWCCRT